MNQDTKDFIQTWQNKISDIKGDDLGALFNKYSSFYILYNRLYNDSFKQLKSSDALSKSRYSDFDKATRLVVQFNSANDIIKRLEHNNNFKDIEAISYLIKNNTFHINLADGIPQNHLDEELLKNLTSEDFNVKAQAIVATIYNVRSNMEHGEKHFEQHQRLLLEPLINILRTIVDLQIDKLT